MTIHEADLTQVTGFNSLVKSVVDEHGKLDFLFNNAGVGLWGKIGEFSEEDYGTLSDILLKAPIFMTQAAMPYLKVIFTCFRIIFTIN